jgi:hypothetical protein
LTTSCSRYQLDALERTGRIAIKRLALAVAEQLV